MENKCHTWWKTLWEKGKLLVTSNFSFSHNFFHSYISLVRRNAALCGNGLTLYHTVQTFNPSGKTFENVVGKGEIH